MRRSASVLIAALLLLVVAATPAGALLTGVDVASHQHPGGAPIDWVKVRAAGHSYALVKATEGTTYTNPYFVDDWTGAGAAGLYRGAYHYARPALPYSTAGTNPQLGCRTVVVPSEDPFGNLEVALSVYGFNYLKGWALDPSADTPISVTAYLYSFSLGTWATVPMTADLDRPDVGAAYGHGSAHGYVHQAPRRGVGAQFACVVGTNIGDGSNAFVGCALF